MTRCRSVYQNTNPQGKPLRKPVQCTLQAGHPIGGVDADGWKQMHQWMRPGQQVRWPESAESYKKAVQRAD